MNKFLLGPLLVLILTTSVAHAQDYPYEDYVPQLKQKKEYDPKYKMPVERPKNPGSDLNTVFGVNLQAGGTFTLSQDKTATYNRTVNGPGYALALGFGWDMLSHPISIEVETGFQQNLMGTTAKFIDIPVKFSTYYWTKLSQEAVFRIGVGSSLNLRMTPATLTSPRQTGVVPVWHFSMIYEYASFTLEPALQVMRIKGGDSFLMGAFYLGYRI